MSSFRKSLVTLAGLSLLAAALTAPLSPADAAAEDKEKGPRKFYLTKSTHDGSQALSACAAGYHMASLWEIFAPSNLRYDTALGLTLPDSGSGPPIDSGWIRTGGLASGGGPTSPGLLSNCLAWTSADPLHGGTIVGLISGWNFTDLTRANPWVAAEVRCGFGVRVWCVQD
jgi:hypothetical protein